ncbi:MAG: CPBP family intramembrane metalloprotease [Labilithrix sp.]|nr:CPBP family intramembrane metalloprotease [Labilithrix sp.]
MTTLRQTLALALLVVRYWARAGLPNRLRKDQGRRASGALLRATFLLLMVHWGYRIGVTCAHVEDAFRPQAVAWMLLGLTTLAMTWGAMGRGPGMRGPQSPLTSPLLDAVPVAEAARVIIGLFERLMLYALTLAALFAVAPQKRLDLALLGVALPTAGLLLGDAMLRAVRTAISPFVMARVSVVVLVMQFPGFMLLGGAPVLAKIPAASRMVAFVAPAARAVLEGTGVALVVAVLGLIGAAGAFGIRAAERIGYDRVDVVPSAKLDPVRSADLDLVHIEHVLAQREPGGRWLARGAFLYTFITSGGLLAIAYLSPKFPMESVSTLVRSLGFVAIFGGFAVVQARATRMVVRDAGARAMLAPLPIGPSDLLQGKTRALLLQALLVASPYFLLLALPASGAVRFEVIWRGVAIVLALMFAASATVAVAFLTQGLGGVRVFGGSVGIETTLVLMPLLAVAASPYVWSAVVSLGCLGMLAFEARRSALRCVRWIDDADDFERETPIWRALLVFAAFQAAQTLAQRALAFAPIEERVQVAAAYGLAAVVLVSLTAYGRRGLPRARALPPRAAAWLAGGLLGGLASGAIALFYLRLLQGLHVELKPVAVETEARIAIAAVAIVLAPLAEEIFFRGWLQSAIDGELPEGRRRLAPLLAAFAFAAVHPPLSFAPVLVLGLVCGGLYAKTRSVAPGIAAHVAHNAVATAATFLLPSALP